MRRRCARAAAALLLAGCAARHGPEEPMPDDFAVERAGDREVVMRRTFAARPDEVFAAMTEPARLRRWLRAGDRELSVCEVDLRPGGSYRYEFRLGEDRTFGMGGTYREVVPGERIVHTESYDGYDWAPLLVTTTFAADGPRTRVTVVVRYPSEAIRDRDAPNLEGSGAVYRDLAALLAAAGER